MLQGLDFKVIESFYWRPDSFGQFEEFREPQLMLVY